MNFNRMGSELFLNLFFIYENEMEAREIQTQFRSWNYFYESIWIFEGSLFVVGNEDDIFKGTWSNSKVGGKPQ